VTRTFSLLVNQALHISREVERLGSDRIRLMADGGVAPYQCHVVAGSILPRGGVSLSQDDGTISISRNADLPDPAKVTIRATDAANHACDTQLSVRIRRIGLVRRRVSVSAAGEVLVGSLEPRALQLVREWAVLRQEEIMAKGTRPAE
jgi:hypothetical protein